MNSLRQRLNVRDESAFTLIELLVVLIIIGVLLAIAIPSYLGFQKKAQQTAAQSDVREAIPDAEAYYSDNNSYASMTAAGLQTRTTPVWCSPCSGSTGIAQAVGARQRPGLLHLGGRRRPLGARLGPGGQVDERHRCQLGSLRRFTG